MSAIRVGNSPAIRSAAFRCLILDRRWLRRVLRGDEAPAGPTPRQAPTQPPGDNTTNTGDIVMQTQCATTDDNEQGLRQQSTRGFGRMTPVGVLLVAMGIGGCMDDAHMASRNLSKAADNFEIVRRVVFYNGITDSYMLTIEGLCSIKDATDSLK